MLFLFILKEVFLDYPNFYKECLFVDNMKANQRFSLIQKNFGGYFE